MRPQPSVQTPRILVQVYEQTAHVRETLLQKHRLLLGALGDPRHLGLHRGTQHRLRDVVAAHLCEHLIALD